MSSIQIPGLPKIPRVLGIIANTSNSRWQETGKQYATMLAMKEEENQLASNDERPDSNSNKSMTGAITRLQQQMSSLRQLDGYLLCQLMSLHASIIDYRSQVERMLSESSDVILEDDEDYELEDNVILPNK